MALAAGGAAPALTLTELKFSGSLIKEAVTGLSRRNEAGKPGYLEVRLGGWQCRVPPAADKELLVLDYLEYRRGEASKGSWMRLRRPREDASARSQATADADADTIRRIVDGVNTYFAQWTYGTRGAKDCVNLIKEHLGPGTVPPRAAPADERESWALTPPGWDLLP